MTQFETLAQQGSRRTHTGLAALDSESIKQMRSQQMRNCFTILNEQKYRMEMVARVRGMAFFNDAASRSANATWYALTTIEGKVIWIANGINGRCDYRRMMKVAKEKVVMLICVGPHVSALHKAFDGVVDNIMDADNLHDAVNTAYCSRLENTSVVFSPAGENGTYYEEEGAAFTREVNEL